MFSYVLYSVIINRIFRGVILASSAVFFVFSVYYFLTVKNNTFDSLPASIESILIVAYSIFYLFDQMNKPQVIFIYQEPHFWFVVAFIIYFSGTLFLFIQASNLTNSGYRTYAQTKDRPLENIEWGRTYLVGVSYKF